MVYVAVPHNLHETIYLDVLKAGKDLLAEKPLESTSKRPGRLPPRRSPPGDSFAAVQNFPFFPARNALFARQRRGLSARCWKLIQVFTTAAILTPTSP